MNNNIKLIVCDPRIIGMIGNTVPNLIIEFDLE